MSALPYYKQSEVKNVRDLNAGVTKVTLGGRDERFQGQDVREEDAYRDTPADKIVPDIKNNIVCIRCTSRMHAMNTLKSNCISKYFYD